MADFSTTWQSMSSGCESSTDRLKKLKTLLDATEEALFASATGGALRSYKVNTGQTVIDVEVTDIKRLQEQWTSMYAFYNEMCGIVSGSNVMAIRDAYTLSR